ncbi:MAG: CAP domain-containing protein [Bacteroidia bacterium]
MKRGLIAITLLALVGCVSIKKYKALELEVNSIISANRATNREIARVDKKNKLLEDSISKMIEIATLESTKLEKRLAQFKLKVKLNQEDLKGISVRNQDIGANHYKLLLKEYNFKDTNSAKNSSWLSPKERELIYWLNFARLNPSGFCKKYIFPKYTRDSTNIYIITLIDYMLNMKPVPALMPDKKLFESAFCHAETMGKEGKLGHSRIKDCKSSFSGECCSYGLANPLDIVLQLLIDERVSSLGHRYICLGTYSKVGVSIMPHKTFGTNCVLDFGHGAI